MRKRKPYIALLLSIVAPGLGHIYCGKLMKGFILLGLIYIYFPIVLLMGMAGEKSSIYYVILMASIIFSSLVMIYTIIDAFFLAKREKYINPGQANRPWVYAIIMAVAMIATWLFPLNIRNNHVQAFKIPASSMIPNLLIGDYLFADKAIYKKRMPRRGEIVIFLYPRDRQKYFIKRVIGLPGDRIEIRGQEFIINGRPLNPVPQVYAEFNGNKGKIKGFVASEVIDNINYSTFLIESKRPAQREGTFTVPDGHCFVMGDNRFNSHDSRHFGSILLKDIIGRADFIYFPAQKWSRFGKI